MKNIISIVTLLLCFSFNVNAQEKANCQNNKECSKECKMDKKECAKDKKNCSSEQIKDCKKEHKMCASDKMKKKENKECCSAKKADSKS
jgi:hypothetical protein